MILLVRIKITNIIFQIKLFLSPGTKIHGLGLDKSAFYVQHHKPRKVLRVSVEFYCHPFNDSSIFSEIVRGGGGGYLNLPNVGVSKAFFSN